MPAPEPGPEDPRGADPSTGPEDPRAPRPAPDAEDPYPWSSADTAGAALPSPSSSASTDVPGISVEDVSRSFGPVQAVLGLSLTAPQGQVTALVGPNGCGKSTLMLMLASLLAPSSGTVRILGKDPSVDTDATRRSVGWMPDQFGAWDSLRVREVLDVVGRAYDIPRDVLRPRIDGLLRDLDLESLASSPAHVLSRGQKQRLGLARSLVHDPRVLVLDEPASGLDPAARRRLLSIVRGFAAKGGTVLISSHILSELEEMADRVVFMDQGYATHAASLADLAAAPRPWRIRSLDPSGLDAALRAVGLDPARLQGSSAAGAEGDVLIRLPDEETAARLLRDLTREGARITRFGPATGRLESAYLDSDAARREGAL